MKVEAKELISKDAETMVENNGGIKVPKEERSDLGSSVTENVKVPEKIIDENKNQGCGVSNGIYMENGEKIQKRRGRPRKEKEAENGIKKEGGVANGQEHVEMRENGVEDVGVRDVAESENSKDMERKRGRPRKVNNECMNRGSGEGNVICMENGKTKGKKARGRPKKKKELESEVKKEKGVEYGQEDVEMREDGVEDVGGREDGCNVGDMEKSKDLVQENDGTVSAVEEGKVMEEDKDSLGEAEKAECCRRKELEDEDNRGEKEEGRTSEKKNGKVEMKGLGLSRRKSDRLATIETRICKVESEIIEDIDEEFSSRVKKRRGKKKENDETSLKENGAKAKIAQMEDEKSEQRKRRLCNNGTREGEGKELNVSEELQFPSQTTSTQGSVTKTRIGLKKDDKVGRLWNFINLISLQL